MWLLPLGYLVIRSGYFPKVLGILLLVAGVTYVGKLLLDVIAADVGDRIATVTSAIEAAAEMAFIAWLLVKGVRAPRRDRDPVREATRANPGSRVLCAHQESRWGSP